MTNKFTFQKYGLELEVGKYATQASGAAWLRQGGTVVLATACHTPAVEFPGFFPLTVEYREEFSAAGKIPGGYLKREGKTSDKEVLVCRVIDRTIRPLFPDFYFDQVQVIATVLSVEEKNQPYILSLLASSLALTLSKIPFGGPVGGVEAARVNGEWIFFPSFTQVKESDTQITICGNKDGICMVEGSTNQISESDLVDVMFKAHEIIKEQVAWQLEVAQVVNIEKDPIKPLLDWQFWKDNAVAFFNADRVAQLFIADKNERYAALAALKLEFATQHEATILEKQAHKGALDYVLEEVVQEKVTQRILETGTRVDGRPFDKVRPISVEVGILPMVHGSAVFNRGKTQALVSVTLGGGQDEQRVEDIFEDVKRRFMLHYNFPPYSVGEVKPMRGPGRREIGHGYLAASAIKQVLPDKEAFPYSMRIIADMLGSDGSTSMATVCGSTMALMHTGVPIKSMVSGVAMGLLQNAKSGAFQTLTDISGFEDAFGLMDFKVAGTEQGITAIQMDIKYKSGLAREVFVAALAQAKDARLHILNEMRKVMSAPNTKLSELVPAIVSFKIAPDKIGAVIGSGGKIIKEIIEKTGTSIDIEDDGTVKIMGGPNTKLSLATEWVKTLAGQIEVGSQYAGKVRRVTDFGIFVELVPGQDGLVHISLIPREKQRTMAQEYPIDSIMNVEVADYDRETGRIRLRPIDVITK